MNRLSVSRRRFAGVAAGGIAALALQRTTSAQQTTVTPEDFGAVGDLDGDKGTDNTTAFHRLADYINRTGGSVQLNGRYRIRRGFPILAGTWTFSDNALVRNTTRDGEGSYWASTAAFVGTYFGFDTPQGMNAEPGYPIGDVAAGSDRVLLQEAIPANIRPGALVFLLDANRYPGARMDFRQASHVSVVTKIIGRQIILRDPSPLAITGSAQSPATLRTDTGALRNTSPDIPGAYAQLAKGVRILNGAFESAAIAGERGCQTVHVSSHDCDLDFRWISGANCLGINPCSDTSVNLRSATFSRVLFELAHYHCRVRSGIVRGQRVDAIPASGVPPVAISEYGHSVSIGLVNVTDLKVAGDAARPTVAIMSPYTDIDQCEIINPSFAGIQIGASGFRGNSTNIRRLDIEAANGIGAVIDCDDVQIGDYIFANPGRSAIAARLAKTAGRNIRLGTASSSKNLAISDNRSR